MDGQALSKVQAAYTAMHNGTGSRKDYEAALKELNGPDREGESRYFLLMAGGEFVRLEDRVTVFTSELAGRVFSPFTGSVIIWDGQRNGSF